jgi:hypothetical protein
MSRPARRDCHLECCWTHAQLGLESTIENPDVLKSCRKHHRAANIKFCEFGRRSVEPSGSLRRMYFHDDFTQEGSAHSWRALPL